LTDNYYIKSKKEKYNEKYNANFKVKSLLDGTTAMENGIKLKFVFDKNNTEPKSKKIIPSIECDETGKICITGDLSDKKQNITQLSKKLKRKYKIEKSYKELEKLLDDGIKTTEYTSMEGKRTKKLRYGGCEYPILKIVYEFAYKHLGGIFLEDKTGERIRKILCDRIYGDEFNETESYKLMGDRKIVKEINDENIIHWLSLWVADPYIICSFLIFGTYAGCLIISENSDRYEFDPLISSHDISGDGKIF
jgi:hypothetical protein